MSQRGKKKPKAHGAAPEGAPHSKVFLTGIDTGSSKNHKPKISAEDHKKRKAARAEAFISKKKGTSTDTNPLHQSKRAQKRAAAAASLAAKQAGTTNLTKNPAAEAAFKAVQSTPGEPHTRVPVPVKTQSAVAELHSRKEAVAALTPHKPNVASPHAQKPVLTLEGTHTHSSTTDTPKLPNTPKTPKAQRRAARRAATEAGLAANKTANNLSKAADAAKIASVALTPHTPNAPHIRPLSFVSGKAVPNTGIHNRIANATGTPKDLSTYVKRRAAGTTPINTPHAQKPVLTLSGTHKESSTSNPIKSKKKGQISHEDHLAARAAKAKKKSNKENAKLAKEQSIINTAQKTSPSTNTGKPVVVSENTKAAVDGLHQKHQVEAKLVASSNKAPTEGAQQTANSIVHSKQSNTAPAYVSRFNRKKIAKEDAVVAATKTTNEVAPPKPEVAPASPKPNNAKKTFSTAATLKLMSSNINSKISKGNNIQKKLNNEQKKPVNEQNLKKIYSLTTQINSIKTNIRQKELEYKTTADIADKQAEKIAEKIAENKANTKVGENISKMFNNPVKTENAEKSKPTSIIASNSVAATAATGNTPAAPKATNTAATATATGNAIPPKTTNTTGNTPAAAPKPESTNTSTSNAQPKPDSAEAPKPESVNTANVPKPANTAAATENQGPIKPLTKKQIQAENALKQAILNQTRKKFYENKVRLPHKIKKLSKIQNKIAAKKAKIEYLKSKASSQNKNKKPTTRLGKFLSKFKVFGKGKYNTSQLKEKNAA